MTGEAYREVRTCQVRATDLQKRDVFETHVDGDAGPGVDVWVEVTERGVTSDEKAWVKYRIPDGVVGAGNEITWFPRPFELVTIQWTLS
jgi:hypothetical protein